MAIRLTTICVPVLLLGTLASAQSLGGDFEFYRQMDGLAAGNQLGSSVSSAGDVNGDGYTDVIVGAPNTGSPNGGSAFVYSGADGSVLYQWDGMHNDDQFGFSVAGARDVNQDGFDDVIIGAPNWGSAFVYSGSDGSLLYQWNHGGGPFGISVSSAGDTNGDGFPDLLVGASLDTVYLYSGADGSELHALRSISGESFGHSVAGAGDVNADGYDDIIIGAPTANPWNLTEEGSVYVYSGNTGARLYEWYGWITYQHFGWSVSSAGDVNGDGFADLVVGAPGYDWSGSTEIGNVYIYSGFDGRQLNEWVGTFDFGRFGHSVAGAGDLDHDGFDDILVGAPMHKSASGSRVGAVFVYSSAKNRQLYEFQGTEPNEFGHTVSDGGNINHDGFRDIVVGARSADPGALTDAGSAFIYRFNPYMNLNTNTISAASGGVINMDLDFPPAAGFHFYKVLLSASGTGPTNYGVPIPLTLDSLMADTFFGNYPVPTYTDLHGRLNLNGDASGSLTVPSGLPPTLIGTIVYIAAIANPIGQYPEYSSTANAVTITP